MKRFLLAAALLPLPALAAPSPEPAPLPPPLPQAVDHPYPGTITLEVDTSDITHRIFGIHETIPLSSHGDVTLLYPKWHPGTHGPEGSVAHIAGLVIEAGGKRLDWRRDPVETNAFHVDVPDGTQALDLHYQFVTPTSPDQGAVSVTTAMLDVQWIDTVLYPAGFFSRGIKVAPSVTLPLHWQYATALETSATGGSTVRFKETTLNTLADSPLYAGRYFARFDLAPKSAPPAHLDVFADSPDELAVSDPQLAAHRALVDQAGKLFGAHHYAHYDFLLALSDSFQFRGLEHHQSSENGSSSDYFTDWEHRAYFRDLLPHEYTHSWNGKFRRPADLWAPDFQYPERDSLLWIYEGQTEYWGHVLAARAGLWTREQALDAFALDAAALEAQRGRVWRSLEDTTNDPIILHRGPQAWWSWQRNEDYYVEGAYVWLDADTLIREKTEGKKSLDDVARAFFGIEDGRVDPVTYTFDDIVHALNDVVPYDWASFLHARLDGHPNGPPLDGLARGGYRLVYNDTESDFQKSEEAFRKGADLMSSIGLVVGKEGAIVRVEWDGPAFKSGATTGQQIVAVNEREYDGADTLKDAIRAAHGNDHPIILLVHEGKRFHTLRVDYHDGLRYPHLERVANTPARLDDILKARP